LQNSPTASVGNLMTKPNGCSRARPWWGSPGQKQTDTIALLSGRAALPADPSRPFFSTGRPV